MVVGDDIAVRRNDEARTERGRFPCHGPAILAATRRTAAEALEQIVQRRAGERIATALGDRDALRRGDVDHRGRQLGGEVREAQRRTGPRRGGRDRPRSILGDLRAERLLHGKGRRGAAGEQSRGNGISVTHDGSLLNILHSVTDRTCGRTLGNIV
jgi:hypothetical protein